MEDSYINKPQLVDHSSPHVTSMLDEVISAHVDLHLSAPLWVYRSSNAWAPTSRDSKSDITDIYGSGKAVLDFRPLKFRGFWDEVSQHLPAKKWIYGVSPCDQLSMSEVSQLSQSAWVHLWSTSRVAKLHCQTQLILLMKKQMLQAATLAAPSPSYPHGGIVRRRSQGSTGLGGDDPQRD